MVEIQSDILNKLKCSECQDHLSRTPIFVKENGDSICGRCPSTTESYRNKAYEDVASMLVFPCRFMNDGCMKNLTLYEVEDHEENCEFQKVSCLSGPTEKCSWKGVTSNIQQHFRDKHNDLIVDHPYKFEHDFAKDNEKYLLTTTFGFLFLIKIKCDLTTYKIYHSVKLIGPAKIAAQFKYYLNVTKDNKRSLEDNEAVDEINTSKNTVVFNINLLEGYFEILQDICFTLTIKRHEIKCISCFENITETKKNTTNECATFCDSCNPTQNGIIQCKFYTTGCTYKGNKNNISKHEQWFCKLAVNRCQLCGKDCKGDTRISHLMNKCNHIFVGDSDTPYLEFYMNKESKIFKIDVFGKEFYCIFTNKKEVLVYVVTESPKEELVNYSIEVVVEAESDKMYTKKLKLSLLDEANSDWKGKVNFETDTAHVKFMFKKRK